jgi:uncharacterized membrane protein
MTMRFVPALLALSMGVNVFLGGFVAGRLLGHHGPHAGPGEPGARGVFPIMAAAEDLSPEGRALVRQTFKARQAELRAAHGEARNARARLAEILAAEPFDRGKAEAALATITGIESENHRVVMMLIVDAAASMTPEDRRRFVEGFARPHERPARLRPPEAAGAEKP